MKRGQPLKAQATIDPDFQFDSDVSTFQRPSASLFIGVQAQSGRQEGEHPMGEKENKPFQLTFNGFLKVDFQGSRVTSDGGLILIRELDERLGLGRLIEEHLSDSRQGANKALGRLVGPFPAAGRDKQHRTFRADEAHRCGPPPRRWPVCADAPPVSRDRQLALRARGGIQHLSNPRISLFY